MDFYIITGTSRGIGEAIVKELSESESYILGVSRGFNNYLDEFTRHKKVRFEQFNCDLGNQSDLEKLLQHIEGVLKQYSFSRIALVNNAAVLGPVKAIQDADSRELYHHVNTNITAPMILISGFVRILKNAQIPKSIFNISSGAANNPYYGWSAYCSSKAAINMLTKVVAEEQFHSINPVKVVSFAPGVVETTMQTEIRQASEEDFKQRKKFVELKSSGKLLNPQDVAKVIVENLFNENIPQGAIIDVRDMNID